jgi:hypothetical protein
MSKSTLAGASALVAAPLVVLAGVALLPTLSDDAALQVAALTDHRSAMIGGLVLQTLAIALLIAGAIWLATTLGPRAPRLALAGGILAVAGSLIPLFENGIAAAAPALVTALDPAQATTAIDRIHSSAAVTALEPFSLLGDLGLALLGVAALRAGAPRWTAVVVAVGAFGEGAGFAGGARPLVLAGFAILFVGLAAVTRVLLLGPAAWPTDEVAASPGSTVAG